MTDCVFCNRSAVGDFRPTFNTEKGICTRCLSGIKEALKTA